MARAKLDWTGPALFMSAIERYSEVNCISEAFAWVEAEAFWTGYAHDWVYVCHTSFSATKMILLTCSPHRAAISRPESGWFRSSTTMPPSAHA